VLYEVRRSSLFLRPVLFFIFIPVFPFVLFLILQTAVVNSYYQDEVAMFVDLRALFGLGKCLVLLDVGHISS